MKRKTVIAAAIVGMLVGGSTAHALSQAWVFRRIAVPAYGYFAKHGHCKTEDMVLAQLDYPDSVEWKCYHIDRF